MSHYSHVHLDLTRHSQYSRSYLLSTGQEHIDWASSVILNVLIVTLFYQKRTHGLDLISHSQYIGLISFLLEKDTWIAPHQSSSIYRSYLFFARKGHIANCASSVKFNISIVTLFFTRKEHMNCASVILNISVLSLFLLERDTWIGSHQSFSIYRSYLFFY